MTNSRKKVQHAEIKITIRKKGGKPVKKLYVTYKGNNSEILAPTQPVLTLNSAHKNIAAVIRLAHGTHMRVIQVTEKGQKVYDLDGNGKVVTETDAAIPATQLQASEPEALAVEEKEFPQIEDEAATIDDEKESDDFNTPG